MNVLTNANLVLAAAASQGAKAAKGPLPHVRMPTHWPAQADLLGWCQGMGPAVAAVLILFGVIYLLFGFNLFKWVVVLNAAAVGLLLGAIVGGRTGTGLPLAIVGAVLGVAVAWPTMKYSVAVMGGTFGALIGAIAWRVVGLEPAYTWSGALTGMVALGLLCFILFRGCVMMYTSFQGAAMLIFGTLGLLLKYQDLAPRVGTYLTERPFFLPMCVFVPTVIGMMYQQTFGTGAPKPAGGTPASAPKK
jgi:hypothetical protein